MEGKDEAKGKTTERGRSQLDFMKGLSKHSALPPPLQTPQGIGHSGFICRVGSLRCRPARWAGGARDCLDARALTADDAAARSFELA